MGDDGFSIEVDTVSFEAGMQRIRKGVREGFINPDYGTLTVQTRLLAQHCQTLTPPRNKAQGINAVVRDLTRVYRPLSASGWKDKDIAKIVRNDDREAWNVVAQRFTSSLKNTRAIPFSEAWHKGNKVSRGRSRGFRGGKPGRKAQYADNIGVVTLGSEATQARAYTKKVAERVGWARAGWNMGIISMGGQVAQPWVARFSVTRGAIEDGRQATNPFVRVINDTGWAKYGPTQEEGNRIIRNAIQARARAMQTYAERMSQLAVDGETAFKIGNTEIPAGMFGAPDSSDNPF